MSNILYQVLKLNLMQVFHNYTLPLFVVGSTFEASLYGLYTSVVSIYVSLMLQCNSYSITTMYVQ